MQYQMQSSFTLFSSFTVQNIAKFIIIDESFSWISDIWRAKHQGQPVLEFAIQVFEYPKRQSYVKILWNILSMAMRK